MRRPEVRKGDFDRPVNTPDFESKSQLYAAMPRDVLIVVSIKSMLIEKMTNIIWIDPIARNSKRT